MVRGKRVDGPKSNPVHFDFRDDALMTFVEKVYQVPEILGLGVQKSPQGFHLAGSQDFDDGSGNHQPRIWWSWRELNPRPKFLHPRYYMLSQSLHSLASCGRTRH